MSEQTREERRRKILENSQKRLDRLSKLKLHKVTLEKSSDLLPLTKNGDDVNDQLHTKTVENTDDRTGLASEKTNENEPDIKHDHNKISNNLETIYSTSEAEYQKETTEKVTESNSKAISPTLEKEENKEEKVIVPNDSFFAKKYRFILFTLLAWAVYLVTVKDFDNILAYLIGKKLPKENLPVLVITTFAAVELQVMFLDVFVRKDGPPTQSMFMLGLRMFGVSELIIKSFFKLTSVLSAIISDFCVYSFVLILLTYLDSYM